MSDKSLDKFFLFVLATPIVLFLLFILFNFMVYIVLNIESTLTVSDSPDKSYKIIVRHIDPLPGGLHEIHVYYKKKGALKKHKLFTTHIDNDEYSIDNDNCKISWNNRVATIIFNGCRQGHETYIIDITETKKYKKLE